MANRVRPLHDLFGAQLGASDPADLVWLSASAGTGKTHVLTARVLRLLLNGAPADSLLCLTFTKAAAAEMADRVNERLAYWVRLDDGKLARELKALGEPFGPEARAHARTLFAKVIDSGGGGLRIQTIHAFCQTLLAGFPVEAGLAPGFRPLEGREEATLARATLAELLVDAERGGDLRLIGDVELLSLRLGETGAERYLLDCARDVDAMAALGAREGIEARVRRALDVPLGDVDAAIEEACEAFDTVTVQAIANANAVWGTKTGLEAADICGAFVAASAADRTSMIEALAGIVLKKDGEPRTIAAKLDEANRGYGALAARLGEACRALTGLRVRAELAAVIAAGLRAGRSYALAFDAAKRAAGRVGFDDLIRAAGRLLETEGTGEWVRYKLDQQTDHILVDEAQDTNARQWAIVAALAGEYFVGEGAKGRRHRTIFTVGDFKQAIFGFQGTDPMAFQAAKIAFMDRARGAERAFLELSLDRSFRSSPPVLMLVDRLIEALGADTLGLAEPSEPHVSARAKLPGCVTLLRPVSLDTIDDLEDEGEEDWAREETRELASRIARQVRAWIDDRLWIAGRDRPIRPEDVMILVRRRGELAALLVARLHAEGVPVAGVDRLRLDAPLAVRDLLAVLRFAVQPEDDLTLANLLVSPLIGLDHAALHGVAFGRRGSLWAALREASAHRATADALRAILADADFIGPHAMIERILSGPLDGRRRLLARLGPEARDPIEELVSAALAFEAEGTPSLQRFLDWFDRGEVEITRDPSAPLDAVRVMTVHGSKGLQAPVVILADATGDPDRTPLRSLEWAVGEGEARVRVIRPRKQERHGSIAEAAARSASKEREEHWRLLYVAATRAEERLVIGGALRPRQKGVPPAASWYQAIDRVMEGLGAGWEKSALWGATRHYIGESGLGGEDGQRGAPRAGVEPVPPVEPPWLRARAPVEARPPRPLAPSAVGRDDVADPPSGPALAEAGRRGTLLHALFERLPAVAPDQRARAADRWLAGSAGVSDEALRRRLIEDALAVIDDPAFAELFGACALAEAPIAAVVGEEVIAGTVDRLLVTPDHVRVVDFKTGRQVPASAEAAPRHHIEQMAAYVDALGVIFPNRVIEAALLYTAGPRLIRLSPEFLAAHKRGLTG